MIHGSMGDHIAVSGHLSTGKLQMEYGHPVSLQVEHRIETHHKKQTEKKTALDVHQAFLYFGVQFP